MDALRALWTDAGLTDVATREITVARTFEDFEDFWASAQLGLAMAQTTRMVSAETIAQFEHRLCTRLPADGSGRITYTSRANAITGNAPA